MTTIFIVQLIITFVVGGSLIAFLSFLAERTSEKIAGIIISLPSTSLITYIFMGWTLSPETVANVVPATIITIVAAQSFVMVFVYVSKIRLANFSSLLLSLVSGLIVWAVIAIPIAIGRFSSLPLSLIGYTCIVTISYYFLTYQNKVAGKGQQIRYTATQKIGRGIFAGCVITTAVFLSKTVNPFWGGVLSSFPATYFSSLVILRRYHHSDMLFKVAKSIPFGSLIYMLFILAVRWTYPAYGIIGGSIIAYLISLLPIALKLAIQSRISKHFFVS